MPSQKDSLKMSELRWIRSVQYGRGIQERAGYVGFCGLKRLNAKDLPAKGGGFFKHLWLVIKRTEAKWDY